MQEKNKINLICISASALLSALLVYIAGNIYGPGFTYDSVNYIYAGYTLAEKGKLLRPFSEPYIEWPPLYPIIIALLAKINGNLSKNVFFLQTIIAGITVWIAGWQMLQWLKQPAIFIAAFLCIVFSTPIVLVNHFIWSESFFCLLVVIQFILLTQYQRRSTSRLWYALLVNGMLLCVQRHVGVFFITGTILILWMYPENMPVTSIIKKGIIYGFLSILPLLLWWARNYSVKGQIINDYSETLFVISFTDHFLAYHNVFTAWFMPDELNIWLRIVVLYTCISWLTYSYFAKSGSKNFIIQPSKGIASSVNCSRTSANIKVLIILFLSYFLLTYAASFTVNEFIDDRILAPVYIPGIWLFFIFLDNYLSSQSQWHKRLLIYGCLAWTVYPITRTLYNVYTWHHQSVGIPASQPVEEEVKHIYQF